MREFFAVCNFEIGFVSQILMKPSKSLITLMFKNGAQNNFRQYQEVADLP